MLVKLNRLCILKECNVGGFKYETLTWPVHKLANIAVKYWNNDTKIIL